MSKLPRLTARQSEAAVERAAESVALTSGAGCGKTLVLARRFTTLLLGGGDESPFERFVALTFTDKAALEMISRVRTVLQDALASSRDPAERSRLAGWITELPAAHISTIHSFCASLLRRYAVEAGVDPNFAVATDDLLCRQMRTVAAEAAVGEAVESGDEGATELLARAGAEELIDQVRTLLERRIAWQDAPTDPDRTLRHWLDTRRRMATERLAHLAGDAGLRGRLDELAAEADRCADPADKLLAYCNRTLGVIRSVLDGTAPGPDELAALRKSPRNFGGAKAWGGRSALVAFRRWVKEFVAGFADLHLWLTADADADADADAARCLATLLGIAGRAAEMYDRAKRRQGTLDFEDLIRLTSRLLRDRPAVRDTLRRRMDQLLIDECQDIDAFQLEMLWRLLADGDVPPPGKLFVVGDIKQSIYRFRGAQAEVFEGLCRRFGEARIGLVESFRMHRAGVAFVNQVFGALMGDAYEPIASSRKELPDGPSVEILLAEVAPPPDAAAAGLAQAELVAQRIDEMVGREKLVFDRATGRWRDVRPGDVAVLFARMTNSLAYEHALQRRELPYHVVGGLGFFRQQEVYDVLNACRAIDNPFDDVALFGVLRSAIFGLDDNVLLHVATAARPPYFDKLPSEAVLEGLPAAQREQLAFAAALLARIGRVKDALGPAGVIERLLAETGYAATLLSQFHGPQKLANVRRLLDAARSAAAGGMSLADFVRRYGEMVMAESRFEQAPVAGESADAVRIMTIHRAKGLEFPVVIVPDLNARFRGPAARLLFRHDLGVVYRPATLEADDDPPIYQLAKALEAEEIRREDCRKLYVAATRHQDHLILIGADWRTQAGLFESGDNYLRQLDDVLNISATVDAGGSEIECGGDFAVRVARITPSAPKRRRSRRPIGLKLLSAAADGGQLADALASAGDAPAELPLVAPLPVAAAAGRIAPTALADFEHCPMLYRWRHELRAPAPLRPGRAGGERGVDAATAGTFFHRCMELVDFDALGDGGSGPASTAAALAGRVAGEMQLDSADALADELAGMLRRLADAPLARRIASAPRRLRELAFSFRAGPAEISGKIDLLYEDADGPWHVVDYKSDRVGADEVPSHAARYELQMMLYLAAARRQVGEGAGGATLYFLRPGLTHDFPAAGLDELPDRLADLAERLTRCRRSGTFPRRHQPCERCPYGPLCLRGD